MENNWLAVKVSFSEAHDIKEVVKPLFDVFVGEDNSFIVMNGPDVVMKFDFYRLTLNMRKYVWDVINYHIEHNYKHKQAWINETVRRINGKLQLQLQYDYKEDVNMKGPDLPPIQDCVPEKIRTKILRLAVALGYDMEDIIEAGYYELECPFNFEEILKEMMDDPEWFEDDDGKKYKSYYLGKVFSIYPSGKYYTPFANSNVTEDEMFVDELFHENMEKSLLDGMYLINGEGDPTDLYVVWYPPNQEEVSFDEDDPELEDFEEEGVEEDA